MDSFKNSNMQGEQVNSNLIQHRLWNPVPRKVPRTDESQTNLMTNILCNLIQETSNVKPVEETKPPQGNIFQYTFLLSKKPSLTKFIGPLLELFSKTLTYSSDCRNKFLLQQIVKITFVSDNSFLLKPLLDSDLCNVSTPLSKTEVSIGSQVYQNDVQFDLFKSS